MTKSSIEWTEHTWNPVVGCTKISPGCKHCYAENLSRRLRGMGVRGYDQPFTTVRPLADRLEAPLLRKTPSRYFVNSMSDLFHEDVDKAYIDRCFEIMRQAHWHTFQVLTKRAERLGNHFSRVAAPRNVWLGVSVEDQRYGIPRIDHLRRARATVRFLSVEPLLEDLGRLDLRDIHWVIVGGESGAKARPMKLAWALSVQSECRRAKVPFFFKQWGAWGEDGMKRAKHANGRELNGRLHDGYPLLNHLSS